MGKKNYIQAYDSLALASLTCFIISLQVTHPRGPVFYLTHRINWLMAILVFLIGVFSLVKNPKIPGFKSQPTWAILFAYFASALAIAVPIVIALRSLVGMG